MKMRQQSSKLNSHKGAIVGQGKGSKKKGPGKGRGERGGISRLDKIYGVLLTHEFMSMDTIARKTGLDKDGISNVLTKLRRAGLAEYSGTVGQPGGLHWKKHPREKPLYPAQADIRHRKGSPKERQPVKASAQDIIRHISGTLDALKISLIDLEEAIVVEPDYEAIEALHQVKAFLDKKGIK